MHHRNGFTMLELLVTMSILAISVTIAAPSFTNLIKETRTRAQVRDMVAALEIARSNAVMRRHTVTVCSSTNGAACAGSSTSWASGWIVLDTVDNALLQAFPALTGGTTVTTAVTGVTFDAYGEIATSTQLTLRPNGCTGTDARLIDVVSTGLVNVQTAAC